MKARPRHIILDGKSYQWSELVRLRRKQLAALKSQDNQPALFELRNDVRPETERKASGRYLQRSLFD
jgi:hypothetical protein